MLINGVVFSTVVQAFKRMTEANTWIRLILLWIAVGTNGQTPGSSHLLQDINIKPSLL